MRAPWARCVGDARELSTTGELLEACGLVPYQSAKPPKIRAEHSPAIKYPRVGQS